MKEGMKEGMKKGLTTRQKIAGGTFWGGVLGVIGEAITHQDDRIIYATGALAIAGLIGGVSFNKETTIAVTTPELNELGLKQTEPFPPSGTIIDAKFREINKP